MPLAMDKEFAKEYPDTVKAIISGWYDALAYMESNPEDAYKIMMEYTGDETPEALQESMKEVSFYDKAGMRSILTEKSRILHPKREISGSRWD